MEKPSVLIQCEALATAPLARFRRTQGNLKTLSEEAYAQLRGEIRDRGFSFAIHVWVPDGKDHRVELLQILDGHQRLETLERMEREGWEIPELPYSLVRAKDLGEAKAKLLAAASQYGQLNIEGLRSFLEDATLTANDLMARFRFPEIDIPKFVELHMPPAGATTPPERITTTLSSRFLVPPFSVLDARQGYWKERKNEWMALGIKSEEGRAKNLLKMSDTVLEPDPEKRRLMREEANRVASFRDNDKLAAIQRQKGGASSAAPASTGTSIFDPVLCELAYRWFSPKGGTILDPFAGGSVRGIAATVLGRDHVGVELREEQVKANRAQATELCPKFKIREPQWIHGDSREIDRLLPNTHADLIFSCPPYADLEVYSDDPRDISNMDYADFRAAYFEIIRKSCERLKENRFACFVIGEVRDKKTGAYRNFVGDTIEGFRLAGLDYYNEAILVTSVGTLPIRTARIFSASRKLGKTHQNVLVFVKGNASEAVKACGEVAVEGLPEAASDGEPSQS